MHVLKSHRHPSKQLSPDKHNSPLHMHVEPSIQGTAIAKTLDDLGSLWMDSRPLLSLWSVTLRQVSFCETIYPQAYLIRKWTLLPNPSECGMLNIWPTAQQSLLMTKSQDNVWQHHTDTASSQVIFKCGYQKWRDNKGLVWSKYYWRIFTMMQINK